MQKKSLILATCVALALVLGLAGGAWAAPPQNGPDDVTFTSFSATVNSTAVDLDNNGQNYYLPADLTAHPVTHGTVNAGDTIVFNFTVGASGPSGGNSGQTAYPDTVAVTATTASKPSPAAPDVNVTGLTNCAFQARTNTFSESATMIAPSTAGAYQVKILADDGKGGNAGAMTPHFFFINFTVVVPTCTPAPTTLKVDDKCVVYHAPSVSLTATLTKTSDGSALVGKTIEFYVDDNLVGSADTISTGVATLTYDPSSLLAGNHSLSAAWQSDDPCLQSSTAAGGTLGITYLFLGFQQPINGDGSSQFGGRCIPVKIKIADYNGVTVPDADCQIWYNSVTPALVGLDAEPVANTNGDSGNTFRYDPSAEQYIFNWDVAGLSNGTYKIIVGLNEGSCADSHSVNVTLKKKGSK